MQVGQKQQQQQTAAAEEHLSITLKGSFFLPEQVARFFLPQLRRFGVSG